ncbi:hypothetical protein [Bacillus wiedmannii]|uniref:hypothetical protein n=1 Tax=Bacillus wiedmannii TaxID=1890302 RepID=UPI000BF0AB5B|nr:hypothetical protein [Bacillus wiedmannii]PEM30196.1 hypothetical protein CN598_12790 [Bacillus wiedmannii]
MTFDEQANECARDLLGRTLTDHERGLVYHYLPSHIIQVANDWGWDDTEVGDYVWRTVKDHIK